MKSPITDHPCSGNEFYYNKIPDYYVGLSPAINILSGKCSLPSERNCAHDSDVYDKIPPYITEFCMSKFKSRQNENQVSGDNNVKKTSLTRMKINQMEERRIVYVGNVKQNTTLQDLRMRFDKFGVIEEVKLHFREIGDSYGFVTYSTKEEAINAIQHGNDDPLLPKYDLCFGGRRHFCRSRYSDLDGNSTIITKAFRNKSAV